MPVRWLTPPLLVLIVFGVSLLRRLFCETGWSPRCLRPHLGNLTQFLPLFFIWRIYLFVWKVATPWAPLLLLVPSCRNASFMFVSSFTCFFRFSVLTRVGGFRPPAVCVCPMFTLVLLAHRGVTSCLWTGSPTFLAVHCWSWLLTVDLRPPARLTSSLDMPGCVNLLGESMSFTNTHYW